MFFILEELKEPYLDFLQDIFEYATKSETGITLRLLSNMSGNSNDETNFPHKLL